MMFHPLYMFLFRILLLPIGVWGEKQKLPLSEAKAEFVAHFRAFYCKRELQRWETLVEAIGLARAQEIAAWADKHLRIQAANQDVPLEKCVSCC